MSQDSIAERPSTSSWCSIHVLRYMCYNCTTHPNRGWLANKNRSPAGHILVVVEVVVVVMAVVVMIVRGGGGGGCCS